MSIEIRQSSCVGCGLCSHICPGSLIKLVDGKAAIPRPERCWGCASCVKACPAEAIALFLGADMGGMGGKMTARQNGTLLTWTVTMPDSSVKTVTTDSQDSNKY